MKKSDYINEMASYAADNFREQVRELSHDEVRRLYSSMLGVGADR